MPEDRVDLPQLTNISVDPETARGAYDFFSTLFTGASEVGQTIETIWTIYSLFAFALSALFIYGIIYSYIRANEIAQQRTDKLLEEERLWRERNDPEKGNRRWNEVEAHVASNNPNDWKLAIIEADVMLDKMLQEHGFAGTTVADRLRSAAGRSFGTIEDAWQAHRVRNQIAHGGTDFVLTQRMAQATITQYRRVFEEFGVV